MQLEDYLDVKKLEKYVATGLVTCRTHDTLPISILCYGKKALFSNTWDDVTCKTRGLIVDNETHEILARPYEKFFSYDTPGQSETYPRSVENVEKEFGQPVITEKINGCLGIFWRYKHHWGIASKGSFHSPHAAFATKWMEDHIEQNGKLVFPEGYTPVFEIICQEIQPHVIKYEKDGLVLLNFVNNETGNEEINDIGRLAVELYGATNYLPIPYRLCDANLQDALNADLPNEEGYVATYNRPGQSPLKIKIKFPTFLVNRKKFYAEQKAKETTITTDSNLSRYAEIQINAAAIVQDALVQCTERHEFVAFFNRPEHKRYRAVCIAMLDTNTKKYQELIWKMVKNGS